MNELLLGIFLTLFHGKSIVVLCLLYLTHLIVDHANVVVAFRELGPKKFPRLLAFPISFHAPFKGIQSQRHLLIELQVEQPQIEIGFYVTTINLQGLLVKLLQILEKVAW